MVQFHVLASAALAVFSAQGAIAHPGEYHDHLVVKRQLRQRDDYGSHVARSLEKCKRNEKTRALHQRAVTRRSAAVENLRKRNGIVDALSIHKRNLTDFEKWSANSHNETGVYNGPLEPSGVFAANTSCVVTPEDTVGPYYVLGENIRSNVTEGQAASRFISSFNSSISALASRSPVHCLWTSGTAIPQASTAVSPTRVKAV